MVGKAPGKSHRTGISLVELIDMFPDEATAVAWWEGVRWPDGRFCPRCGATDTKPVPNARPMPYWCSACASYFSVRTGTSIEKSRLPMRKWAIALYLYVTNLKGVSSMKLHRDLKVTQKTAWYMLHRLRDAWGEAGLPDMAGPVEADETYVGGRKKNMSKAKRREVGGRGASGKAIVAGVKDRESGRVSARSVPGNDARTLQGFVAEHAAPSAKVFTDNARAYQGMRFDHEAVNHSVGEYVRGMAHTNGIESFWAMLKRGYQGTYHHMSVKHLDRYVGEFAGRHNVRNADTIDQMRNLVASTVGKRLMYRELISPS